MLGRRGTGVAEHSMGVEWGVARGVEVVWKERDKGRDEGWGRGRETSGRTDGRRAILPQVVLRWETSFYTLNNVTLESIVSRAD